MSRRRGFGHHYATDEEVRELGYEPGKDGWMPLSRVAVSTPSSGTVPDQTVRGEAVIVGTADPVAVDQVGAGAVSELRPEPVPRSQPAPMPAPGDDMALGLTLDGSMFCPRCGSQIHQQQRWQKKDAEYRRDCHDCQWTSGWLASPNLSQPAHESVDSQPASEPAQQPAQGPDPATERAQEPRKRPPRPGRPTRPVRAS